MTALPGGDADKLGNRFEDWWTLLRLADVLQGRASRMRIEPPGPDGEGIEFWIDELGSRWGEQVKSSSWTVSRLITKHVLSGTAGLLGAGHRVRLVLATEAADFSSRDLRGWEG